VDRALSGRRVGVEAAGYAILALGLFMLLWRRVRAVDSLYLDEWFYMHGAQYIWEHLPLGALDAIPRWNRGPQRLYSALMAPVWGTLSPSPAYNVSHALNVGLLVSSIAPAALYARRVIDSPWLRILAVALAVAVPWLTISAHLLTENLAFPLFLWAIYLIVRAAEDASLRWQFAALVAIGALSLVRLNLAFTFGVLVAAVAVAEARTLPHRQPGLWRRRWPVLIATALAGLAAVVLAIKGSGSLGAYGGLAISDIPGRIFGTQAREVRITVLTYSRWLVEGGLVLPLVLGLAAALAGSFGRLGPRLTVPAVAAVAGFVAVVGAVSVYTVGAALEERYVFYAYAPMAVMAVAGLAHLPRLGRWLAVSGGFALWTLIVGIQPPSVDAGNFFASPSGAFWARVVFHRVRALERDYLGWTLLTPTGWLLVAIGLGVLLLVAGAARRGARWPARLLTLGLVFCALAQVAIFDYSFKQELYGTRDVPGGIALTNDRAQDRETFVDEVLPDGARAIVQPALVGYGGPYARVPELTFWNKQIDATLDMPWNLTPAPAPPGFDVYPTTIGEDGLAALTVAMLPYLVAPVDDPRLQFETTLVQRSKISPFAIFKTTKALESIWTAAGLEGDGAVLQDRPVILTLDRATAVKEVELAFHPPAGAPGATQWRVLADGKTVAEGRISAKGTGKATLPVPECPADAECPPASWRLVTFGRPVGIPFPVFGYPGPERPVTMYVDSAHLVR
jgi:hypothetical protein